MYILILILIRGTTVRRSVCRSYYRVLVYYYGVRGINSCCVRKDSLSSWQVRLYSVHIYTHSYSNAVGWQGAQEEKTHDSTDPYCSIRCSVVYRREGGEEEKEKEEEEKEKEEEEEEEEGEEEEEESACSTHVYEQIHTHIHARTHTTVVHKCTRTLRSYTNTHAHCARTQMYTRIHGRAAFNIQVFEFYI